MSEIAPPLLIVLGPTASGKESAAVYAAEALDAELIVADSVKPYRGLEIAAAAPPREHVERVQHHLVGCLPPTERLNARLWVELAETAIADVRARGKTPLVVGGTALYLKALLFGLFAGPEADHELRARLRIDEEAAPGTLHERLRVVDPVAADRIHRNDLKRLLRALEVYEKTGRPISDVQREWGGAPRRAYRAIGLRRTRDDIRNRIERRIARMVEDGLVDEIDARVAAGDLGATAAEAIGVKELVPLLTARRGGEPEPPDALYTALEAIRAHTWQLAKRQTNWWKRFPDVEWLDLAADESASAVGARVAAALTAQR
jgi:tRNA dimethylallyltransferase